MPANQQKGIISGATATPATPQIGASARQNSIATKPIKPATVAPASKGVASKPPVQTNIPPKGRQPLASARARHEPTTPSPTAMPQSSVQAIEGIRTALREKLMNTASIGVPNPGMGITR